MKINGILLFCLLLTGLSTAQTNILSTNSDALEVLKGNYDPAAYAATTVINDHDAIIQGINAEVNPDSLLTYLRVLVSFGTRHTASDTVSSTRGYGAARRWAMQKLDQYSAASGGRLLTSYLQFNQQVCSMGQHRNVFAVLPGTDTANHKVILIEGHMDTRCESNCDTACDANGAEDNGSGTALVLELARVMSQYSFKNTIMFMLTTGEEQGLLGAQAFADYTYYESIPVEAVLNNDVIGGIICGQTSSPPSCPGFNHIDSTQVRMFSYATNNSPHKNLVRYIKLQYQEELQPLVSVPMELTIMSAEDRSGRGGDHIPFRQRGIPSMRFTAANEHGDASVGPGYTDRQHTDRDILGVDTNNDQIVDSFYVDFNYLARNAVINGVAASMIAIGPEIPAFTTGLTTNGGLIVNVTGQTQYGKYRVGLRSTTNEWDSVYTMNSLTDTFYVNTNGFYYLSVAAMDSLDIESLFLFERDVFVNNVVTDVAVMEDAALGVQLLQNKPNPFDYATTITVHANQSLDGKTAYIKVYNMLGQVVRTLPITLEQGMNEVLFDHGYDQAGILNYTLEVDGKVIATKRMVFQQ